MAKKKKGKNLKNSEERKNHHHQFVFPVELINLIGGMVFILLAIILSLSFFELSGEAGKLMIKALSFLIGRAIFIFPLIFILSGLIFFKPKYQNFLFLLFLAIFLFLIGITGFLESLKPGEKIGGWMGSLISPYFFKFFGFLVTEIIFTFLILISGLIFWQLLALFSLKKEIKLEKEKMGEPSFIKRLVKKMAEPKFKVKEIPPLREREPVVTTPELKVKEIEPKPLILSYQPPPLNLLESDRGGQNPGDITVNAAIIKKTLQNFDIPVEMSEINVGPTVTQYTLKPAEGIKLSKITALSNDLALALASHPIRIEAPIPGRALVGIEVPNKVRALVRLRDLIQGIVAGKEPASNLTFALGRDVSGNPVYADLAKMPHLLVAGSTGTGKTVQLNSIILSLIYRNSPEILRFILIDPKRVEFSVYNDLPHLLAPVIFDAQKAVNALKWLIGEMERRFDILSRNGSRDIASYNEKVLKVKESPLPYIVLIIDELADLMAARGREVEAGIVRLAQMARAVGIHLVVATQRPSVEVITGLIKANITSRITFQVASQVDSRTVLDMAGAEKLLGQGDMLYLSAETAKPKRIQAAYITEKEVKRVVDWLKSKVLIGQLKPEIGEELKNSLSEDLEKTLTGPENEIIESFPVEDPLYPEAKRVVIEAKKASASLLQRRLKIGYARAARLIDLLEEKGVVGPSQGAKPREVYFTEEEAQNGENTTI